MKLTNPMFRGVYAPFASPFDPCPPVPYKIFVLPPQLFIDFQSSGGPVFDPETALFKGTLWPELYDGYSRTEGIS